ncbi:hypothetical protein RIEGSTA812A_PEG_623 [invertebrate metagenome]|uniref:Uncharacterized protein n=1 Tax=invertebrate metagenome TaxID=1711999 RepID=A0A484H6R4_9ZZZZ
MALFCLSSVSGSGQIEKSRQRFSAAPANPLLILFEKRCHPDAAAGCESSRGHLIGDGHEAVRDPA